MSTEAKQNLRTCRKTGREMLAGVLCSCDYPKSMCAYDTYDVLDTIQAFLDEWAAMDLDERENQDLDYFIELLRESAVEIAALRAQASNQESRTG